MSINKMASDTEGIVLMRELNRTRWSKAICLYQRKRLKPLYGNILGLKQDSNGHPLRVDLLKRDL